MAGRYEAVLTAAEKLHVRLLRLLTGALTCTLWTMPVLGSLGIWDLMTHGPGLSGIFLILGFLAAYVCFLGILCWMCLVCRRLRIARRLLVWLLLWIPFLNYGLALYVRGLAKQETDHILYRISLDDVRAEKNVCSTKYPLLLVHGVGFRDFHYFNYWGRIPRALKKNGARVFYGHQEAWGTVEENAGILREKIFEILRETGEEKVNIIAHSKGGLDSRYLISGLHMAPYVASLTTICTPHRGSMLVDLLMKLPDFLYRGICGLMDRYFGMLGDRAPNAYVASRQLSCAWTQAVSYTHLDVYKRQGEEDDSNLGDLVADSNAVTPEGNVESVMLREHIDALLGDLKERERQVIVLRFGLEDGHPRTLEEVGKEFNVTRERIRQIEAKALRKLRNPVRSKRIRDFL